MFSFSWDFWIPLSSLLKSAALMTSKISTSYDFYLIRAGNYELTMIKSFLIKVFQLRYVLPRLARSSGYHCLKVILKKKDSFLDRWNIIHNKLFFHIDWQCNLERSFRSKRLGRLYKRNKFFTFVNSILNHPVDKSLLFVFQTSFLFSRSKAVQYLKLFETWIWSEYFLSRR